MEGEVRSPRLVDDQRHLARVGDLGQRGHIGHRAEIGGRDDGCAHGARRGVERTLERLGGHAVRDVQLGIELRRDEGRAQARQNQRVDRARVRVALGHDLLAEVGQREQRHVVALGSAVDQEPGSPRAPCLGCQPLSFEERRGLEAHVDSVGERGNVEGQRLRAEGLDQARIGRRAALVSGHMEAAGVTGGVRAQRVEVGGVLLGRRAHTGESTPGATALQDRRGGAWRALPPWATPCPRARPPAFRPPA